MKYVNAVIGLFLTLAVAGCGGSGSDSLTPASANEFRIGGLFSLTGNWNTLGNASKAALELAQDDVNAYNAAHGIATRVKVVIADTKLDPATAKSAMQRLHGQSVDVFIGPQSSSEVANLVSETAAEGTVLISQGSTASSLSIAGDNVFRMVPDDVREARALVALAQADGIQALVPVARDDAGNGGLYNSVTARFTAVGGQLGTGVRYSASATDFTETLASIRASVTALKSTHSDAQIGVYLAGFDEVAGILSAIKADPVLSSVKWYGSDGVVQSVPLLEDAPASGATTVGFPNPIFGLNDADKATWEPIAARIKAKSGVDPDAFALSAYDAVWLAAKARETAGATWNVEAYKAALTNAAASYTGVTGPTTFDVNGDRDNGNFDFWSITGATGSYKWSRVAVYEAADGSIVRTP